VHLHLRRAMHGGERLRSVVHRVAIFNKEGTITDIVSQSDVIRCVPNVQRMLRARAFSCWKSAPDLYVYMLRRNKLCLFEVNTVFIGGQHTQLVPNCPY